MEKTLNLTKILKDAPKGTKLYSPLFGVLYLTEIEYGNGDYPIICENKDGYTKSFTKEGKYEIDSEGECILFPSKDNRDWNTFKIRN